jgi:hypothetical protein
MKAYTIHDGRKVYMVAAKNRKEAAVLLKTTPYQIANCGAGCSPKDTEIAISHHPKVLTRRMVSAADWELEG